MSSLAGDPPPGSGLLLVLDAPLEVNYSNYTWNAETLETGLDTHTHTLIMGLQLTQVPGRKW